MHETAAKVYAFTWQMIAKLSEGEEGNKGAMAEFRRSVGTSPNSNPRAWGFFLLEMPDEFRSKTGIPTLAEWAIFTAITFYAIHQQGKNPNKENVCKKGEGLGKAIASLSSKPDENNAIIRRFNMIVTASNIQGLVNYTRPLIRRLKDENINLDYPALAQDLYWWQISKHNRNRINMKWGEDFYRNLPREHRHSEKCEASA